MIFWTKLLKILKYRVVGRRPKDVVNIHVAPGKMQFMEKNVHSSPQEDATSYLTTMMLLLQSE